MFAKISRAVAFPSITTADFDLLLLREVRFVREPVVLLLSSGIAFVAETLASVPVVLRECCSTVWKLLTAVRRLVRSMVRGRIGSQKKMRRKSQSRQRLACGKFRSVDCLFDP